MRAAGLVLLAFLTAACAVDAVDPALDTDTEAQDAEAQTGASQAPGKADAAPPWVGLYTSHASSHKDGDLRSLQLLPVGAVGTDTLYVRERCYHTSCALPLPETDRYDVYTSTAGKTYVRFWSFTVAHDSAGNLITKPTIADVYELKTTSTGLKLRKSYTTRWFSLTRTTVDAQCTSSGGTPNATDCACPLDVPGQFPVQVFAPGAGGCMARPADNESNCDDSNGLWTDDDATLTGAFCTCGVLRYVDGAGSCAAI